MQIFPTLQHLKSQPWTLLPRQSSFVSTYPTFRILAFEIYLQLIPQRHMVRNTINPNELNNHKI